MNPRTPAGQAPQACAFKARTKRASLTWLGKTGNTVSRARDQAVLPHISPRHATRTHIGFPVIHKNKHKTTANGKNV
ncbi:MAG: hypothetical protein AUJ07_12085 [Crenarchaeota archaeon 13_1_40CM_3_53_5]|nr:MAG: hypothetical protein AUJ07_12085 [Crenarchaeota archaeon 13_1_40CM_3_53_5]